MGDRELWEGSLGAHRPHLFQTIDQSTSSYSVDTLYPHSPHTTT